jgi:hypothetical protein
MHTARIATLAIACAMLAVAIRHPRAAVAGEERPTAGQAAPAGPAEPESAAPTKPAAASATDDDARAERVRGFVSRHQPELAELLARLEKRKPAEYATALADLDRTVLALEASRAKDERLHEIELRAWQARTRIDLLVARWMTGAKKNRPKLEAQLREAIAAEIDTRAEHLAYRRQRSVAWYDRQIDRLHDKRDDLVTDRLQSLLAEPGTKHTKQKPPAGDRR